MAKFKATKTQDLHYLDPNDLVIVGIDTKHKSPKDHHLFDERIKLPLDDNMVKNIMVYGVQQTVICQMDGDELIVVDGRQRVRWAREANKRLAAEGKEPYAVPIRVKKGSEATMFGVMVSLNEIRQDDELLLKADKAVRMQDMGKSTEEIAITFGVTTQAIDMWLKLADASTPVREAVQNGQIAATAAAKLAELSRDKQKKALKELIDSGNATVAHAQAQVRAEKRSQKNGETVEASSIMAPGKRAINKLIKYLRRSSVEHELSEDFIKGMRWAVGDLSTNSIGGLAGLLEDAKEAIKDTKPEKEAKPRKAKKGGAKKPPPRISRVAG